MYFLKYDFVMECDCRVASNNTLGAGVGNRNRAIPKVGRDGNQNNTMYFCSAGTHF